VDNLRFADDIDIIEHSNEKLQDRVDKLHTESAWYGMHINVVKTKTEENDARENIDGQAIENVKSFIYLGNSLLGIMTVPKTYKDYSRNSSVQRVTIYTERQWNND